MDTTTLGPIIHIVSSKNSNPQRQQLRYGQQPNRNRLIPSVRSEQLSEPKETTDRPVRRRWQSDLQGNSPPPNSQRGPSTDSHVFAKRRNHTIGSGTERPTLTSKRRYHEASRNDPATNSAIDLNIRRVTNVNVDARNSLPTEKSDEPLRQPDSVGDANSKPKAKKKAPLSVPTNSVDVSRNWEQLKATIGAGRKPKRIAPVSVSASISRQNAAEDGAVSVPAAPETAEMPVAKPETFVKTRSSSGLTKAVAMDCEFVGVGPGAQENMLARVSIVNLFGHCLYDTFVKPTELVKDYRTHVSGVRPQDLKKGEDFKVVQEKVAEILRDRILVGHALSNDLEALLLSHPKSHIRDTSKYKPFRTIMKGGTPSLKKLTAKVLGVAVQTGEHDSIQDAQAAMRLYTMHKRTWESKLSFRAKKARLSAAGKS